MKIMLANPRGFCAGVIMAIDTVDEALKIVGAPLYVYHEIVHNRHVVEQFVKQGVIFVDSIDDVPDQSTVVFSAHGVSPAIRNAAKQRDCTLLDATCPLVTKVHMEAIRYAKQGYHIVLIGHAGHDEVVGTVGEAPHAITIVESPEDVEKLTFTDSDPIAYITQTTLSKDDAEIIIAAIRKKFPQVKDPPSEDICYATTNRQDAIRILSKYADLVLIVGSQNSSNSLRLAEIAENLGTPAHLIDDRTEINPTWLENVDTLLLSAGASAPEHLVQEIIENLRQRYGATIDHHDIIEEDMHFELPRSLRVLREEANA